MPLLRVLVLGHRYLGIVLGVLVAAWFASGIVMIFVDYPGLDEDERLAGLEPLPEEVSVRPGEAARAAPGDGPVDALRITAPAGQPYYLIRRDGAWHRIDARTGKPVPSVEAREAVAAARRHAAGEVRDVTRLEVDQWSLGGSLDGHRPLYRVDLSDPERTAVYVSSRTGEVVRDATRPERFWGWLGPGIHWIYPWQLRQYPELWRQTVVVLSGLALALAVTGLVLGLLRLRRERSARNAPPPAYARWLRWHHLSGLGCALFLLTFLLSGLLSVNPGGVFNAPAPGREELVRWQGGALEPEGVDDGALGQAIAGAREVEVRAVGGAHYLIRRSAAGEQELVPAGEGARVEGGALPASVVSSAARRLLPGADPTIERLKEYDAYYSDPGQGLPLPVYRVAFDDDGVSTFYVDPGTAEVVRRIDTSSRARRWLYDGLHRLDLPKLIEWNPVRESLLLVLCLGGLAFSTTGVVIAWQRLARVSTHRGRDER